MNRTQLTAEIDRLTEMRRKFDAGEYVELQPDLGGWSYVTTYFSPVAGRERSTGHEGWTTIASLALDLGWPVVITAGIRQWVDHITRRLTEAGVTVMEDLL